MSPTAAHNHDSVIWQDFEMANLMLVTKQTKNALVWIWKMQKSRISRVSC